MAKIYAHPISSILEYLLMKYNISEVELSKQTNIPRATINGIRSGRTPDPRGSTLESIAGYFEISIEQLMGKKTLEQSIEIVEDATLNVPIYPFDQIISISSDDITKENLKSQNSISVKSNEKNLLALKILDNAMYPSLRKDTIVIVTPKNIAKIGDYVVLINNNKPDVHRVMHMSSKEMTIESLTDSNITHIKPDLIFGTIIKYLYARE